MREDSAHARNNDLSAAAEIFANGTCFPNRLRKITATYILGLTQRLTLVERPRIQEKTMYLSLGYTNNTSAYT